MSYAESASRWANVSLPFGRMRTALLLKFSIFLGELLVHDVAEIFECLQHFLCLFLLQNLFAVASGPERIHSLGGS